MIAQTIQLALAPVFVLVAVGNILNLLSTRLGRIVDRSRRLQELHRETSDGDHDIVVREIRLIDRRIDLIGRAILMLVLSGIAIGLTVALLFLEAMIGANLQGLASVTFILAIGLLTFGLILFLRETRQASRALRIPEELLEKDRQI